PVVRAGNPEGRGERRAGGTANERGAPGGQQRPDPDEPTASLRRSAPARALRVGRRTAVIRLPFRYRRGCRSFAWHPPGGQSAVGDYRKPQRAAGGVARPGKKLGGPGARGRLGGGT